MITGYLIIFLIIILSVALNVFLTMKLAFYKKKIEKLENKILNDEEKG